MRTTWIVGALAGILLAGCGEPSAPTGVATNPPGPGGVSGTPGGTPSASGASGVRTVLSTLGLNIHSAPMVSAPHLGTVAQGVVLSVLDHTDQNGGWYKVQGQTVTGWITGDPTLTAPGQFQQYQSTARNFSALYPQEWTFAEEPSDTLFHPLNGPQSLVVRTGAKTSDFGPGGATGYLGSGQTTVIVCGVTGNLNEYSRTGSAPVTPTPGTAGPLALLAQIRLRLDATHALALDYNYSAASDLEVFNDVYNSMTFPYPQCQAPAPAAPTPT
ncbi:MAG: SH3 domain-containing protein [Candidatus Dormibacter sp.]